MSKLNAIREMLQKVLATFERLATDKALLEYDGDELEVGMAVHGIDEEGNPFELENGEYRADDGTVYVIEDGKVIEIREVENTQETEPEEAPAEEPAPEEPQVTAENAEEEPQSEEEPEADPRDQRIADLESEIARLEEENGALRERIAELENKPAAEPAEAEFEKVNAPVKTGNKKLDNLSRILNA